MLLRAFNKSVSNCGSKARWLNCCEKRRMESAFSKEFKHEVKRECWSNDVIGIRNWIRREIDISCGFSFRFVLFPYMYSHRTKTNVLSATHLPRHTDMFVVFASFHSG